MTYSERTLIILPSDEFQSKCLLHLLHLVVLDLGKKIPSKACADQFCQISKETSIKGTCILTVFSARTVLCCPVLRLLCCHPCCHSPSKNAQFRVSSESEKLLPTLYFCYLEIARLICLIFTFGQPVKADVQCCTSLLIVRLPTTVHYIPDEDQPSNWATDVSLAIKVGAKKYASAVKLPMTGHCDV